ncbi:MAG: glycosyltransferase family 4 protein [Bacteroidota bacterium]
MRVLFATNQAVALHHGGIRTQIEQTKNSLESLGVTVTLFDMWKPWDAAQFDLVHIFSANIATYHFARSLRVRNIPFVVSPVYYTRRSGGVVKSIIASDRFLNLFVRGIWTDYGLIAEMCGWAHAVLPNTKEEAKIFKQAMGLPDTNVFVVPNGVEERFAKAPADLFERQYGVKDFILYVGQIGPHRKNVYRLLCALENIDHSSVVIGPADASRSGVRCMEKAKDNPRLLVIDQLSHDSMLLASAYAACKVFAFPTLYETPGIAALEAASTGANIVMTPYGGTREYFQDDVEYVEPTSVSSIEQGIRKALLKNKNNAFKERIRQQYSWQKVGEETKRVYNLVLGL